MTHTRSEGFNLRGSKLSTAKYLNPILFDDILSRAVRATDSISKRIIDGENIFGIIGETGRRLGVRSNRGCVWSTAQYHGGVAAID